MTPDVAIKLGEQLLKEQGLVGWRVCCDADATETCNYYASLGEPGADVVAHCDSSRKIIYLLPSYVRCPNHDGPTLLPDPADDIRNTILHEIVHALQPRGSEAHGKEWKAIADRLGIVVERGKK
ncbi:MAG: SprT-like domain-containing protein [Candidatus Sulfotelmatobacter sp.]|jgi:hypothetical protein